MKVSLLWAAITAAVATFGYTNDAEACACCDGGGERTLVGWSESGYSALVSSKQNAGCENTVSLEVWRPDSKGPHHCFDLFADPNAKVPCETLSASWKATPQESARTKEYPSPVVPVSADRLLATVERLALDADVGFPPARFEVKLWHDGRWHTVHVGNIHPGKTEGDEYEAADAGREDVPEYPIEVVLYPSPDGKRALLSVTGDDTAPGIGLWTTTLTWVTLPKGFSQPAAKPAPSFRLAIPTGKLQKEPKRASQRNGRALSLHKKGQYLDAAHGFVSALAADPNHEKARYNLACALSRAGHPRLAEEQLAELLNRLGDAADARRERARKDDDLAPLRRRPRFVELVCNDDAACRSALAPTKQKQRASSGSPPAIKDDDPKARSTSEPTGNTNHKIGLFGCSVGPSSTPTSPLRFGSSLLALLALLLTSLWRHRRRQSAH